MAAFVDSTSGGDPGMLENLFQQIITDLKSSFPIWDDFTSKASKLHVVLRSAVSAVGAFLESMQKVADMALGTRGSTSDLGSALTRLCLRQRALEDKMKSFVGSILQCLVNPLQDRMDEWKKMVTLLEKDHTRESKRVQQEMKKAFTETIVLKKKAKKGKPGAAAQLELAVAEYKEKYEMLETLERNAVRMALSEERSRFCYFVNCLNPVMECQMAMLSEITHVTEIISYLQIQSLQPCFMPSQFNVVHDWRKTAVPENAMMSSPGPGSPSVYQGSSRSSQSGSTGDGCCNSPTSPTSVPLPSLTTQRQQSNDVSNETVEGDFKSSNSKVQRSSDHCAKCCYRCQMQQQQQQQSPVNEPSAYAIPATSPQRQLESRVNNDNTAVKNSAETDPEPQNEDAPVTGYVNMNQLASLAVQQQQQQQGELNEKMNVPSGKNDRSNVGDNSGDNGTGKGDTKCKKPLKQDEDVKTENNSKQSHRARDLSANDRGRSRITEDIVDDTSQCVQIAGLRTRFGHRLRDLSLPSTFRKPFQAGPLPKQIGSPQNFRSLNRGEFEYQQVQFMTPKLPRSRGTESPPPPPLPEEYQMNSELVLESDYLPPPPPDGGGKEEDANTFASVIQQGVKLRRTATNDRSAPRLPVIID